MLTFSVGFKAASNSKDVSVEQLSSFMFLEEDSWWQGKDIHLVFGQCRHAELSFIKHSLYKEILLVFMNIVHTFNVWKIIVKWC